ncbi:LOW QUALITY PROTEIN: hypothetical protein U9M48_000398 [Paspalum notatum var. saurae]|uniref:Reverse transcriptase zinc-binding domain-containing protein n=1 Tax=Paspalum notatum var. saurae TaxID=547442 RepID=A0AAQ3PGY1_PASNO
MQFLILSVFEQLSGLKINFHRSEIFFLGQAKETEHFYSVLFGCKIVSYTFQYLGLPMHYRKLNNKDWSFLEERIEKKFCSWKSNMLSTGGRLVLLNSVLSSLPMFMLSFFEVPKGVLKKIEHYKKWLFKLCNEDGIWQSLLIRNKYLTNKTLSQVSMKPRDSQFWKSLMGVKEQFLDLGKFILLSGNQIRFWDDKWLGNHKLSLQYPNLFNIVRHKHTTVAEVLNATPLNVSFRRSLEGIKNGTILWRVSNINTSKSLDCFVWGLHKNGSFTMKLMYKFIVNNGVNVPQEIWRVRVPLNKIKIFLWYLKRGVILTKDNLAKRNWKGSKACEFCSRPETIQHLFFECHYAKFLWRSVHIEQLLFVGHFGSQGMTLFLTKENQKLTCKYYSGEHIGYGFGPGCSAWMTKGNYWLKLANNWSHKQCTFLLLVDGLLCLIYLVKS